MGLGFTIHTVQYDLAVRQTNCLICIEDDGKSFTKIIALPTNSTTA